MSAEQQNEAMTMKALEDRVVRHANTAEASLTRLPIGNPQDIDFAIRIAEVHASLGASVARLIECRTRRYTPKPSG